MVQSGYIYGAGSQPSFPVLYSGKRGTWGKHIDFARVFPSIPNVLVAPNKIDAAANCPITVTVKNITTKAFDVVISTWGDVSKVWGDGVTWLAYDEN